MLKLMYNINYDDYGLIDFKNKKDIISNRPIRDDFIENEEYEWCKLILEIN